LTILRANFSENRFHFLLRSLRFDNINTRTQRSKTDKLAPIRDFLTKFISNCQNSYSLGECTTIDEMLVAFRGRCSFIQYMAKKPVKYGLKIYVLCNAQTFYTYNLEIYCGVQNPGPYMCKESQAYSEHPLLYKAEDGLNKGTKHAACLAYYIIIKIHWICVDSYIHTCVFYVLYLHTQWECSAQK
jgi:hypothetical protein